MPDTATLVLDPGEDLVVLERVVVAPARGVFAPLDPCAMGNEGALVEAGQAIGTIESSGAAIEVRSPFTGSLMGMLAHAGERLREGEPVAWLRVDTA